MGFKAWLFGGNKGESPDPKRIGNLIGDFLKSNIDLSNCKNWSQLGPYLEKKGYLYKYDGRIYYIDTPFVEEFSRYLSDNGIDSSSYTIPRYLWFAFNCMDVVDFEKKIPKSLRAISKDTSLLPLSEEYLLDLKRTAIIMDAIWNTIQQ